MKKLIVITSGKGGVGKTTTAINLGAALNYFGRDVLVIDGNLSTPNVGIHLGSPETPVSLNHVISGKAEVFEAVYEHASGLKIMPSSISVKELDKIRPEKMKNLKKDFKKISDYVIVDSAAGLGHEAMSSMDMADELIIVTNPEMPAVTDALKTAKIAESMNKNIMGVIVTRVKDSKSEMSLESIKEMLELPILGVVPEDSKVQEALSQRNAVFFTHPKSKAAKAYKRIAANILGKDLEEFNDSLWDRIMVNFGFR